MKDEKITIDICVGIGELSMQIYINSKKNIDGYRRAVFQNVIKYICNDLSIIMRRTYNDWCVSYF